MRGRKPTRQGGAQGLARERTVEVEKIELGRSGEKKRKKAKNRNS